MNDYDSWKLDNDLDEADDRDRQMTRQEARDAYREDNDQDR